MKKSVTEDVRWDLSNVYRGLDSADMKKDWQFLKKLIESAGKYFDDNQITKGDSKKIKPGKALADKLAHAVELMNKAYTMYVTLDAFVFSFYSTDSYNKLAAQKTSELEKIGVALKNLDVMLQGFIGTIGANLEKLYELNETLDQHRFYLQESYQQSVYLMSEDKERLAAELALSGGQAFSKLQGVVSSQLSAPVAVKGKAETMPMAQIRNLAYSADEKTRKAGYEAEIKAWETVREPIAAALNGVKGHNITLNKQRGRKSCIDHSLDVNRIDEKTLKALLSAMGGSFEMFRKYFKKKASRLGEKSLSWWNLFAPAGKSERRFTYKEACEFVVDNFNAFSKDLGGLAARAFKNKWIDVYPRDGKRGGAFCMPVPKTEESRILCNFDGSFEQVLTIAHELGHAYHNECQKGLTMAQRSTPMTLAETASIFCETIILNAALKQAGKNEKLALLETQLIGASQLIVDIYSRYLFEKEVFDGREKNELSAGDFCEIMLKAQKATYGSGVETKTFHKYMWAVKLHYYMPELAFYNYPYAFGFLFGLGLYKIFDRDGQKFVPKYNQLLRSTGLYTAADLTKNFSIDITKEKFWLDSLNVVKGHVDEYLKL
jgi:pepF/M3 family oligoendopeptidase